MLKKVFFNPLFGDKFPQEWMDGFVENVQRLKDYGWYWKIFTPHDLKSKGNVEFIKMDIDEFNDRIEKATGINPHNYIDGPGPHKLVSEYYPANGLIFADHAMGFDFWGHCNWDMVYGRLEKYLPDHFFDDCDIFGNDPNAINGIFSLYRNIPKVNHLFEKHPHWRDVFANIDRQYTFDEQMFTVTVREAQEEGYLRFKHAWMLQYDRQVNHKPKPDLTIKPTGALVDKNGEEMMLFHFSFTKKWPEIKYDK
jgi:hypothetical protein